jgi:hypothetical protein
MNNVENSEYDYISLNELGEKLNLRYAFLHQYLSRPEFSKYIDRMKVYNDHAQSWYRCNCYYCSPQGLQVLQEFLETKVFSKNIIKAIGILKHWIYDLKRNTVINGKRG